jgi:hypothetical protein
MSGEVRPGYVSVVLVIPVYVRLEQFWQCYFRHIQVMSDKFMLR